MYSYTTLLSCANGVLSYCDSPTGTDSDCYFSFSKSNTCRRCTSSTYYSDSDVDVYRGYSPVTTTNAVCDVGGGDSDETGSSSTGCKSGLKVFKVSS